MEALFTPERLDRFVDSVVIELNGCWGWTGAHTPRTRDYGGYGRVEISRGPDGKRRRMVAHRFAYYWLIGPVAKELELDHLCRNTGCCNPEHLEPVTPAENQRRSDQALNIRSAAGRCVHGHDLTRDNLRVSADGRRRCRQCKREADRLRYLAGKEANGL